MTTEIVGYRRSQALPGVICVDARDSPREWRVICPDYAVVVFKTWHGHVRTRGRNLTGEPGVALCNVPGEAMVARPEGAGSFNVLEIETRVLEEWLSEQRGRAPRPRWAEVMRAVSPELRARFGNFCDALEPTAAGLELQSRALDLSELMIRELIAGADKPPIVEAPPPRATARMRECLNEEGLDIDLETLARRAGLSRFQALRAFKRRYGLPPHAYQLCLRISHARRLLLQGESAADVAALCGFADQSHFNRHFKRLNGVTPVQYARGRLSQSSPIDPDSILSRADH